MQISRPWLALLLFTGACSPEAPDRASSAKRSVSADGTSPAFLLAAADSAPLVELGRCWREWLRKTCTHDITMFVDRDSVAVPTLNAAPGAEIRVAFGTLPASISIQQEIATEVAAVPLQGAAFKAPTAAGTYEYTISAVWRRSDAIYAGRVRVGPPQSSESREIL